jgi:glycosyltransferase involved in cell wall biosynthesis
MKRKRLIVIGPLPPPRHGVTLSTLLVLANETLRERFDVTHVDTSDHRTGSNIGRWDLINVWLGLRAVAQLGRDLRGSPGVVYLPLSQSTPGVLRDSLFVLAASMRRWKVAAHLRGSEFREYYAGSHPLMKRWIRVMLDHTDCIAVMGHSLRGVFDGLVPDDRIAVVPNGTPELASVSSERRDPEHVLFLSHLRRRKGVVDAVEAAILVLARRPSSHFTFAGDWESPELEAELRDRVKTANGKIEFREVGTDEERDRLLSSAALLLFPPVEPEGHPRVVLEAMAAGLPVVSTDRGAIAETVAHGESGYVLRDPDPELLAEHTLRLLDDRRLLEQFGIAARQTYLDRFTQQSADSCLSEWLASLAETIGDGAKWERERFAPKSYI